MQRRNASNPVPVTLAEAPVPSSSDDSGNTTLFRGASEMLDYLNMSSGSILKNYRRKLGEVDELSLSWEQGSRSLGAAMAKKRAVEEEVAASRAQMETGHTLDRLVKEKENTKVYQKTLNEVLQQMSFKNSNIEAAQARNEQVETEERGVVSVLYSLLIVNLKFRFGKLSRTNCSLSIETACCFGIQKESPCH
jgi:hypothetical protein